MYGKSVKDLAIYTYIDFSQNNLRCHRNSAAVIDYFLSGPTVKK